MSLTGRVAIVTGGATLIGAAVVRRFVADGAKAVVADLDEDRGAALADEIGPDALFVRADIGDEEGRGRLLAAATEAFGSVDILVNLAAVYNDDGADSTPEQWLDACRVNIVGTARLVAQARAQLAAGGHGAVVNVTSISSSVAQGGRWVYPATKAAIAQLTRSQANDLAADGIRVNSVSPGWTWSAPMQAMSHDDRAHVDRVAAPYHMLGRAGSPEEVAAVVHFLCTDAASVMTGADVAADGGYSALGPEQRHPTMHLLQK